MKPFGTRVGRGTAALLALCVALPLGIGLVRAQGIGQRVRQKIAGMSTGKKVVIVLAGAALLYYLYRKHQAAQQAQGAAAGGRPQLYRSRNGGIYYRDAQHRPVWLTVPNRPVQVPAADVQRYAPNYQQYQGRPVPPAPPGYRVQPFNQYDPSLAGSAGQ
ncbi:MAG: hypothetical protein JO250_18975 [Armatimonadetes bacterium]|nr:hypothetical protein [Armatimonadota bacterium]